ncbi:MAG: DUF2461 domain-containing protein [Candidatus Limiplasma sp.]|nr:DUF2461 domain-containing protein [Candidatus Limiplasma sp.]
MFRGFPEETIRFFLDIRFHNETSYFKAHEDVYRQYVKGPFFSFINALAPTMLQISDDIETRPGKCLARIHRDTRFSKDKSPYRDHLWLLFRRTGESRDASVMYWFELSPEEVGWGVGFWNDNRPAMDALRRNMVQKPSQFLSALQESRLPQDGMLLYGDCYARMKIPPEVPEPLKPYYPRKAIYIKRTDVPLSKAYTPEIAHLAAEDFLRLKPMYHLLRAAADEGMARLDG